MADGYQLPDPLPWNQIAGPLAAAEDAVARLDERLRASPIREGWIARTHFTDAAASLWLEGELVHLEDLVLHDAHRDIRTPTHELTRAHAVLRARRRIAASEPDWALSSAGLDGLRGKQHVAREQPEGGEGTGGDEEGDDHFGPLDAHDAALGDGNAWSSEMAAIDAVVARSERVLASAPAATRTAERDPLVYDLDWDEDVRLAEWRVIVYRMRLLPPVLSAVLALDAWDAISPLQHIPWLGRLLAAAYLRARAKTRAHLISMNTGLRAIPREQRKARDRTSRFVACLDAMAAAAEAGLKDHDRWLLARNQLARKVSGRRSTSRLPSLIDYVMTRPIISAGMIAEELAITPRAAQDMVAELGLREATGRGRYRAWGLL